MVSGYTQDWVQEDFFTGDRKQIYGHVMTGDGDNLYVFGGRIDAATRNKDMYKYDILNKVQGQVTLPVNNVGSYGAGGVLLGDECYDAIEEFVLLNTPTKPTVNSVLGVNLPILPQFKFDFKLRAHSFPFEEDVNIFHHGTLQFPSTSVFLRTNNNSETQLWVRISTQENPETTLSSGPLQLDTDYNVSFIAGNGKFELWFEVNGEGAMLNASSIISEMSEYGGSFYYSSPWFGAADVTIDALSYWGYPHDCYISFFGGLTDGFVGSAELSAVNIQQVLSANTHDGFANFPLVSWETSIDPPKDLIGHSITTIRTPQGSYNLLFGGYSISETEVSNRLYILKQSNTWQGAWIESRSNQYRFFHGAAAIGEVLYVYGGLTETGVITSTLLKFENNLWTELTVSLNGITSTNFRRYGHRLDAYGGQLYSTGGSYSSVTVPRGNVYLFTFGYDQVDVVELLPSTGLMGSRMFHASVVLERSSDKCAFLLVHGGISSTVGGPLAGVEIFANLDKLPTLDKISNPPYLKSAGLTRPIITSLSGCNGDATPICRGGETLIIRGSFPSQSTTVDVIFSNNNAPCTIIGSITAEQITCTLPPWNVLNSNPRTTLLSVTTCENSVSVPLYYTRLRIDSQTLTQLSGGSQTNNIVLPETNLPGTLVRFGGDFPYGDGSKYTVTYGQGSLARACAIAAPVAVTANTIECTVDSGVGSNLVFQVSYDGTDTSQLGQDTVSYPQPEITSGSLQDDTSSPATHLEGTLSVGNQIMFSGKYFGVEKDEVSVKYGRNSPYDEYICDLTDLTETTITCYTRIGSGINLRFSVEIAGQTVFGTDTYSYPDAPQILSISGCAASGCKTKGGEEILISGTGFKQEDNFIVGIGDVYCFAVQWVNANTLSCITPPSFGEDIFVSVTTETVSAEPKPLLSYARPTLTSISADSCTSTSVPVCPTTSIPVRRITVVGNNFGFSDARVLIGSSLCPNPLHVLSKEHEEITCELEDGIGSDLEISVVQGRGGLSTNKLAISYDSCSPGQYLYELSCKPCPVGTYSQTVNAAFCDICEAGFVSEEGSDSCTGCTRGTYSLRRSNQCLNCSVGEYSEDRAGSCRECSTGTYTLGEGSPFCIACPAGKISVDPTDPTCYECETNFYSPFPASGSCEACSEGSVAEKGQSGCTICGNGQEAINSTCQICLAGWAKNGEGPGRCEICSPGTFTAANTSSVCESCGAGQYNSAQNATECFDCSIGEFAPPGSLQCQQCSAGTFGNKTFISACTPCPRGAFQREGGKTFCEGCQGLSFQNTAGKTYCDNCINGQYKSFFQDPDDVENYNLGRCSDCPEEGAVCRGDGIVRSIAGFWIHVAKKDGLAKQWECAVSDACLPDNKCGVNRLPSEQNVMCGKCDTSYFEWAGKCVKCEGGVSGWIVILMILLTFLYIAAFHWIVQRTRAETKIFLYLVQTCLIVVRLDSIRWMEVFDFDVLPAIEYCIAPLTPLNKLWMGVFFPFISIGELFVYMGFRWIIWYFVHKKKNDGVPFLFSNYYRTLVAVFVFSYNSICKTVFQYLNCVWVSEDENIQVMVTQPSVDCLSDDYASWYAFAILLIIFLIVGVPLAMLVFVIYHNSKDRLKMGDFQRKYGVLYETYELRAFWWETYSISRRMILIATVTILHTNPAKYSVVSMWNLIFVLMQLFVRPFRQKVENHLELGCLMLLLLLTIFLSTVPTPFTTAWQIFFGFIVYIPAVVLFAYIIYVRYKRRTDKYFDDKFLFEVVEHDEVEEHVADWKKHEGDKEVEDGYELDMDHDAHKVKEKVKKEAEAIDLEDV